MEVKQGRPQSEPETDMESGTDIGPIHVDFPFPPRPEIDHRELERVTAEHMKWIEKFNLIPHSTSRKFYEATEIPRLVVYSFPWARGPDLDLLTDLMGFSLLFDDSLDKPSSENVTPDFADSHLDIYRSIIDGKYDKIAHTALSKALLDVTGRFDARALPLVKQRYRTQFHRTMDASAQECINNSTGIMPDFDDCLNIHCASGGGMGVMTWAEAVGGYEVPDTVYNHPLFVKLRHHNEAMVALINDLFSARKERREGANNNLVLVLAQREGYSWHDAGEKIHETVAQHMHDFLEAKKRVFREPCYLDLSAEDQSSVHRFITALQDCNRGVHDWQVGNIRYKEQEEQQEQLQNRPTTDSVD